MADAVDQAQDIQLKQVAWVKQDYQTPSLVECEECGNDIPLQRQQYGNVKLCIECATVAEKRG